MSLFFKNREGQTPLDESMIHDLKLDHIQDMSELYEQERENIAEAILWLNTIDKNIHDHYFWLELHKKMYETVWKFAGKVRTIELSNSDFLMPYDVRPALLDLSNDIETWIKFNTYDGQNFAAILHERLLTIHPFKDGNGRWARVLTEYICKKQKIEIPNWGKNIPDDELRRTTYVSAVKNARKKGDYQDLIKIMFHD